MYTNAKYQITNYFLELEIILLTIATISPHSFIGISSWLINFGFNSFNSFSQNPVSFPSFLTVVKQCIKSFLVDTPSASSEFAPIDVTDLKTWAIITLFSSVLGTSLVIPITEATNLKILS